MTGGRGEEKRRVEGGYCLKGERKKKGSRDICLPEDQQIEAGGQFLNEGSLAARTREENLSNTDGIQTEKPTIHLRLKNKEQGKAQVRAGKQRRR